MGAPGRLLGIVILLFTLAAVVVRAVAPSDSPRDADIGQSSYVGGEHNIDPDSIANFTQLWNATFNPGEKVRLSPPLVA